MESKKQTRKTQQNHRAMAQKAVDAYFAALTNEVPSDSGEVNLIDAAVKIEESSIMKSERRYKEDRTSAALQAGYLVGLEVGRRLGPTSVKGGA